MTRQKLINWLLDQEVLTIRNEKLFKEKLDSVIQQAIADYEAEKWKPLTTEMNTKQKQQLFEYFGQEHDIQLLDSDFNEIDLIIQQAIADYEVGKWKKYPENVPDIGQYCYCTTNYGGLVSRYYLKNGFKNDETIIAWMIKPGLPSPYKPKTE